MSPVRWWILTEYATAKDMKFEGGDVTGTELSKPSDPQTSSNPPEKSKDNVDEVQAVSANKPDTIFTSSSEMQSEKTSSETNEVAAQSENIGKLLLLSYLIMVMRWLCCSQCFVR